MMKKRIWGILLALALCLSLLPTAALAEDESESAEEPTRLTEDYLSTNSYTLSGGNYELSTGLSLSQTLVISGNVTLDLCGKSLTLTAESGPVIKVASGTLTLKDTFSKGNNASDFDVAWKKDTSTATKGLWLKRDNTGDGTHVGTTTGGIITGGKGSSTDANNNYGGVYVASGGTFVMQGGNIVGNKVNSSSYNNHGGGVYVASGGSFTMSGGRICGNYAQGLGGGVYVDGSFTMQTGTNSFSNTTTPIISDNTGGYGGGVCVGENGTFTMTGGTIGGTDSGTSITANGKGNTATKGGGVYVDGEGENKKGTFTMSGGTIIGNKLSNSNGYGGGVYVNGGTFTMKNGATVSNNSAYNGGGMYVSNGGQFTMKTDTGSTLTPKISGNTAQSYGGGVHVYSGGTFTMENGSISGNTADRGGGVYVEKADYGSNIEAGAFTMEDGTISGNTTTSYRGGGVFVWGSFTMSGGSITGNNIANYESAKGGGVSVESQGLFYVSGDVTIKDNCKGGSLNTSTGKYTGSTTNNVELSENKYITVTGALGEGASIGVTTYGTPAAAEGETPAKSVVFAQGSASTDEGSAYQLKLADKGHFSYDKTGAYYIKLEEDNNQLTLNAGTEPHSHQWSYTLSDDGKTITATCVGTAGSCGLGSTAGGVSDKVGATYTLAAPTDLTYSNSEKAASVTCDVKSGTDLPTSLTITYKQGTTTLEGAPTDAGTYTASITVGDQTASVTYTIAPKTVTGDMIVGTITDETYNGSAFTPELTVKDGETPLTKDTDYTVSYSDNIYVGMATATITGIGNYTGEASKNFNITAATQTITLTESSRTIVKNGTGVDISGWASSNVDGATLSYELVGTHTGISLSGKTLTAVNESSTVESFTIKVTSAAVDKNNDGTPEYNAAEKAITVTVTSKANADVSFSRPSDVTYGDEFTIMATATKKSDGTALTGGSWNWNYPSDYFVVVGATDQASITLKPLKATTTAQSITATYEDTDCIGNNSSGFTVKQRTVTVSGITADDKVYNSTVDATVKTDAAVFTGKLEGDTLTITATGIFDNANAGANKTVSLTLGELDGASKDNYVLAATGNQPTTTAKINPKALTITGATAENRDYIEGNKSVTITGVTFSDGVSLTKGTDYTATGELEDADAGTDQTVTVTVTLSNTNYTLTTNTTYALVTINKIDPPTPTGLTGKTGDKLSSVELPAHWHWVASDTDLTEGTQTYKANYTISTNYNAKTDVDVTVVVSNKVSQTLNVPATVSATYGDTGVSVAPSGAHGAVSYAITGGSDVVSVDASGNVTILKKGTATIKVTAAGDATYASDTKTVTVNVAAKPVTVTAKDQSIYVNGTALDLTAPVKDTHYTVTGLVGSDTLTGVTMSYQKDSADVEPDVTKAGTYDIVVTATADADKYTVTNVSGTLTIQAKPSSGSSGSSSGGSTVTVPVSSDSATVNVKAEVSKGNATVSVSDAQIDKVAADGAGSVTVDVSGLKNVESATVPAHVVEKTNEAEGTGLTVALPAGSVALDETALESVTDAANGKDVTVSVVSVPTASLSPAVKDIIGMEPTVAAVVDVTVTVNGRKQSSFDGGKLTIRVPYVAKKGEDTSKLTVWFIRDDGTIENKGGWYDAKNKCFVFETDHLSKYLLVSTEQASRFVDVPADKYFHIPVSWAVTNGITGGTDATHFSPYASCTRGQLVTFLWRAAGEPEAKTTANPFSDVKETSAFYQAILWASENNIVGGYADGTFRPSQAVTRANAAAILYRFAAANGMDAVTLQELVSGYADAASVPSYAIPAFNWALATGVITGNNGSLLPQDTCTRAQIVTMLYRLLAK